MAVLFGRVFIIPHIRRGKALASVADEKVDGALGVMLDDFLAAMYPILIYLILILEARMLGAPELLQPLINFLGGSYVQ